MLKRKGRAERGLGSVSLEKARSVDSDGRSVLERVRLIEANGPLSKTVHARNDRIVSIPPYRRLIPTRDTSHRSERQWDFHVVYVVLEAGLSIPNFTYQAPRQRSEETKLSRGYQSTH